MGSAGAELREYPGRPCSDRSLQGQMQTSHVCIRHVIYFAVNGMATERRRREGEKEGEEAYASRLLTRV
jgi:hypothetical protein